jgi:hypothetical protein
LRGLDTPRLDGAIGSFLIKYAVSTTFHDHKHEIVKGTAFPRTHCTRMACRSKA